MICNGSLRPFQFYTTLSFAVAIFSCGLAPQARRLAGICRAMPREGRPPAADAGASRRAEGRVRATLAGRATGVHACFMLFKAAAGSV
jgi:hypothetical protein